MDGILLARVAVLIASRVFATLDAIFRVMGSGLASHGAIQVIVYVPALAMLILAMTPLRPRWSHKTRALLVVVALAGTLELCSELLLAWEVGDATGWYQVAEVIVLLVLGFAHARPTLFLPAEEL
jgi:hypothetical protein